MNIGNQERLKAQLLLTLRLDIEEKGMSLIELREAGCEGDVSELKAALEILMSDGLAMFSDSTYSHYLITTQGEMWLGTHKGELTAEYLNWPDFEYEDL